MKTSPTCIGLVVDEVSCFCLLFLAVNHSKTGNKLGLGIRSGIGVGIRLGLGLGLKLWPCLSNIHLYLLFEILIY